MNMAGDLTDEELVIVAEADRLAGAALRKTGLTYADLATDPDHFKTFFVAAVEEDLARMGVTLHQVRP